MGNVTIPRDRLLRMLADCVGDEGMAAAIAGMIGGPGGDEPVPGDLAACLMALALGDRDGRSRLLRMRPELVRFGRRDLMGTLGHLFAKGGIR